MSLYPYQRIRLSCGCHEIVTGPGAAESYSCPEHLPLCDEQGPGGPLTDAVIDCFSHASRAAVAAERERCAQMVIDYAECSAWDPEEEDDLKELAAKIREAPKKR